jgi:hypothetical protein
MLFKIIGTLPLLFFSLAAQTQTVCEALRDLTDINGKQVRVRGVIAIGDTGQGVFASPPCPAPTVRDGWCWQDVIAIWPAHGRAAAASTIAELNRTRRAHPDCKLVATVTGRLETRDRFEVRTMPDGSLRPVAFNYFVATLKYDGITDIELVPWHPGELEKVLEAGRRPWAVRLEPGQPDRP